MPSTKPAALDAAVFTYSAEDNERLWSVKQRDYLAPAEYLAWCSLLTKDEPPSREITPPHVPPFTL
jgi:hypothetical protein